MKRIFILCGLLTIFILSSVICAQVTDPRVADLVQARKLRVGIGLGTAASAIKDPATGEVRGLALDLGRALATRIGIEFQPVEYPRPGAVLEGVRTNAWHVTFLSLIRSSR